MSYLVLARKWRPQTFADLIGQEHVSRTLGNAITSGRVHHAFLFTGARGVGKTSAARILAKALNCEHGPTPEPCGQCPSCVEIAASQGIDVFEIDGASNTGVDDVRELRENIRYMPSRSRFKIFIIDEVHMLSINAFNALLKTLEEPPEHAKFVFATTEPHKIPVTILSRCQRFDFRKIPLGQVVARLRVIVDAEKIEMSDRALTLVARRGEGSMRDSLSTLDQVIAFCGEKVSDDDVLGILGMVDRRLLHDSVESLLEHDSRRALMLLQRVDNLGHSFRQFCQELVEVFRSLVFLSVTNEDPGELLDVTADEFQELQKLASLGSLEDLQRSLSLLMKCEAELATSSLPKLTLEIAFVRLAHLPPARDVGTLIRKIEDLERRLGGSGDVLPVSQAPPTSKPVTAATPVKPDVPRVAEVPPPAAELSPPAPGAPPVPESPPVPSSGQAGKDWLGLVAFVKKKRMGLGTLLENGSPIKIEPPRLDIGFPDGSFMLNHLKDADNLVELQALAGEYFGQDVTVRILGLADEGHGGTPPSINAERQKAETDRKRRLKDDALSHPMVKSVLEIFEGTVREVRPIDKGFV